MNTQDLARYVLLLLHSREEDIKQALYILEVAAAGDA